MEKDLRCYLSEVEDFRRRNKNFRHELLDLLMLSICTIFSGAEDFEKIELYGKQKEFFLREFNFFYFNNRIPKLLDLLLLNWLEIIGALRRPVVARCNNERG